MITHSNLRGSRGVKHSAALIADHLSVHFDGLWALKNVDRSLQPGGAAAVRQIRATGIKMSMIAATSMDGNFWLDAVPDLSDFYYPARSLRSTAATRAWASLSS